MIVELTDNELRGCISELIATGREDDWWDFKEFHHEDRASLLHDIICMANSREAHDGLIIFGVRDKTMEVIGCENDPHRRNQQHIVDFLHSIKFAGQIRPRVEVRTILLCGHQIDVFIVKKTHDTPYYLTDDYWDKLYTKETGKNGKKVLAAHIYCRVMDNNTPINSNADLIEIEALWKNRFGLLQTPLEHLAILLDEPKSWIEEETVFYHNQFPQYTIKITWDADEDRDCIRNESPEFYHYVQTDSNAYYGMLRIFHYGTQIYSHQITGLDGHRLCVPCPKLDFIGETITGDYRIAYRFYVKESLEYKLLQFLTQHYDETCGHEASIVRNKLMSVVLLFEDSREKTIFENYVLQNIGKYNKLISEEIYPTVSSDNEHERQVMTERIKTSHALKKMQQLHPYKSIYHAPQKETNHMNSIYHRVSIRKYQDRFVEKEKIEEILRAAMQAPSATNQQPWEFYVVTDKNKLEELSQVHPYAGMVKDAPVAIVPAYRKDIRLPAFAQIDMSICLENLWLETDAQGLGGVWLGIAPDEERMQEVEKIVGIPDALRAFAIFPLGYPGEEKEQQDRFDSNRIHWME